MVLQNEGISNELRQRIEELSVSDEMKRRVNIYLSLSLLGLSLEEIRFIASYRFPQVIEPDVAHSS